MAFRKIVGLASCLLLFGCAQLGTLSGGEVDEFAPKPVDGKTKPANESTEFQGNSVSIEFDEYFKLNNPLQTISIVPAHVNFHATVSKKTLKIHWGEQLQENTTYVIYLNGAVKDISEGNDSLMYYVFSTGTSLDSLRYSVRITDAWTQKPVQNAMIGLFTHVDSMKPYYIAKCSENGSAEFRYLKRGDYYVRAFIDGNNDQTIQPFEALAFRTERISLQSSVTDSVPLRLFKPTEKPKIRTIRYQAPGSLLIGANYSLNDSEFQLNGQAVDDASIHFFKEDSIQIFHSFTELTNAQLIVTNPTFSDTASVRISEKDKMKPLLIFNAKQEAQIGPHETINFKVNDRITAVDTSKIKLTNLADSSIVSLKSIVFNKGMLTLHVDRKDLKQIHIEFLRGALQTINSKTNEPFVTILTFLQEKDYGTIHVDASAISGNIVVQLLSNDQIVLSTSLKDTKKFTFDHLIPAEYSFRVISDTNNNGKWDTGELVSNTQPEEIYLFSDRTKVRANWEVSIKLDPNE